jgi:AraC-like DNA-binding protein
MQLSRFSSEAYAAKDRRAILHEVYSAIERVDIDLNEDASLYFDVATRTLPDVIILQPAISPMSRRSGAPRGGKDDIVLAFIIGGHVSFSPQGGVDVELGAGEAYLGFNTRPSRHRLYGEPRFLNISIPRAIVQPRVADLDAAGKGKLRPSPELALLRSYAQALMQVDDPLPPELATRSSHHLIDLVSLALGPRPEAGARARRGGLRHVRLAAIRSDVEANVAQPWMNLETMARRHAISPQYLRALFYEEGSTFSDFVRDRRLDTAHRMLSDPGLSYTRISDIAYACGFGDLSYFNLVFRRRYGMTPSEARHGQAPSA